MTMKSLELTCTHKSSIYRIKSQGFGAIKRLNRAIFMVQNTLILSHFLLFLVLVV